jgi:DeoR/GlpR family transcriptional regulator of sugar metabolism
MRALCLRPAETIVLASAEKLMAASPFLVTSLTEISLLVVPPRTQDRVVREFRAGGVKVQCAQRSKRV